MGAFLGTARGFARSVSGKQRLSHIIAARIDGTGTASILAGSSELTLTDNGTGDYTLTFKVPFKRVPIVVANPIDVAGDASIAIKSVSATAVNVVAVDLAGVAKDVDFHVVIVGFDSADEI